MEFTPQDLAVLICIDCFEIVARFELKPSPDVDARYAYLISSVDDAVGKPQAGAAEALRR
jgi:hypothetical protein